MTLIRRPLMVLAPAVLLVVALALATNVLPLRQIVAQQQEIAATRGTLDQLMEDNAVLDAQVSALDTPIEVERIAREELGYVRPGETAYVVMDPTPAERPKNGAAAQTDAADRAGAASASDTDSRGLVARVWDFVTGRDLAGGG